MKPRVTSIQVMKACYEKEHTYVEYVHVAAKFGVYTHSINSWEYHCLMWENML